MGGWGWGVRGGGLGMGGEGWGVRDWGVGDGGLGLEGNGEPCGS